jgi:cytochrome b561
VRLLIGNTSDRYGLVAMGFHWLIAAAILGMLGLGLVMVRLTPGTALQFELYQWHKSVGITVLALSLLRLAWRLLHPVPALPDALAPWERFLARWTHRGFYVLMIGLPVTGWMMVSASVWNVPTLLYGIVEVPHLPVLSTLEQKKPVEEALKRVHELAAWVFIGLFVLHVAGALKHHFLLRDAVLLRMLPLVPASMGNDGRGRGRGG